MTFSQLLWHMYGFPLAISCCVKMSNIPSTFIKYNHIPLFKAVPLVAYAAAINWVKISIKEIESDGNDVVPSGDHSLRISMVNLRLRDDQQRDQHIRGSHPVSKWEQSSQWIDN